MHQNGRSLHKCWWNIFQMALSMVIVVPHYSGNFIHKLNLNISFKCLSLLTVGVGYGVVLVGFRITLVIATYTRPVGLYTCPGEL